jgi:hypothetical protein
MLGSVDLVDLLKCMDGSESAAPTHIQKPMQQTKFVIY